MPKLVPVFYDRACPADLIKESVLKKIEMILKEMA